MNDAQARGDRPTCPNGRDGHQPSAFWLSRIWRDLEPRRGTLFLVNIGLPILIGMARGETRGALIGCITGLLLSLADNEGSLASRVRLTLIVAGGIAIGALLGIWLKSFEAIFWIAFFLAVFAAGFLNQVGKGPHFSLRFGAISLAVVASFPAMSTLAPLMPANPETFYGGTEQGYTDYPILRVVEPHACYEHHLEAAWG